eukprot:184080_1
MNEPQLALKHCDYLIINNPNNINYIIQNAKTSADLTYYTKAEQLFHKALQITNEKDSQVMYEYGLYFRWHRRNNDICMFYLELALKLDPTNVQYKYKYLTIKHNRYYKSIEMHYDESGIEYEEVIYNIKRRSTLLVSGYINNSYDIIPTDIQRICYQFLMGNCLTNMNI